MLLEVKYKRNCLIWDVDFFKGVEMNKDIKEAMNFIKAIRSAASGVEELKDLDMLKSYWVDNLDGLKQFRTYIEIKMQVILDLEEKFMKFIDNLSEYQEN